MSIFGQQNTFLQTDDKKKKSLVGKDVKAFCSRCKLNLSHTIITVSSDSRPDKVRCNTCKSERTYRAPKAKLEATHTKKGGQSMTDRDEDFEIDSEEVEKRLLGDTKKKPKAKAKGKKKDDSETKSPVKSNPAVPLSMQRGSAEDMSAFEAKMLQNRNNISNAKEYKASLRFNAGEIIEHKLFGIGFVASENGLNKIEVLFKEGRKLLVTAPKA